VRNNWIRADEPSYFRIIITCIVVIQACLVQALPGEFLVGGQGAGGGTGRAERKILDRAGGYSAITGGTRCAAQVVLEDVAQGVGWIYKFSLRYQFSSQVVGCGEIIPGFFIILVDISRGNAAFGLLDSVAVLRPHPPLLTSREKECDIRGNYVTHI
jgi:hypothetical protein